jgi:hypothetical protein
MGRRLAGTKNMKKNPSQPNLFAGFEEPRENWSKLPHALIEALPLMTSEAEVKVVLYVLRHTWGYHDADKRISIDEFARGRKKRDGLRLDAGCGLTDNTIKDGLRRAVEHGFIEVDEDSTDVARIKRYYKLRMREDESRRSEIDPPHLGGQKLTPRGSETDPLDSETDPRSEKETNRKTPPKENGDGVREIVTIALYPSPHLNRRTVGDDGFLSALLDDLDVHGKKRREIEHLKPQAEFVLAHALYAASRGKAAGWVIVETLAGAVPPADFLTFARLNPDEWRALWRGSARGEWSTLPNQLNQIRGAWMQAFDGVFEREPFTEPVSRPDSSPVAMKQQVVLPAAPTLSEDERIWMRALGEMQLQLTGATYETWLARTQLRSVESDGDSMKFTIECHNQCAAEWLSNRLNTMIARTLSGIVGKGADIHFTVKEGK